MHALCLPSTIFKDLDLLVFHFTVPIFVIQFDVEGLGLVIFIILLFILFNLGSSNWVAGSKDSQTSKILWSWHIVDC